MNYAIRPWCRWILRLFFAPVESEEEDIDVEVDEEDEEIDELFIGDGEFYTDSTAKFFAATGALAAISIAGDILLMKDDGQFYKVEVSGKKFRPDSDKTSEKAGVVSSIKRGGAPSAPAV